MSPLHCALPQDCWPRSSHRYRAWLSIKVNPTPHPSLLTLTVRPRFRWTLYSFSAPSLLRYCPPFLPHLPSELRRNCGSSGRAGFPGGGHQLGYGGSSRYGGYGCDSRSPSPDWEIGSRKQSAGLSNLGNTCFMNSSLQCLANIKEFKDFFLTDRFEPEINRRNPIGHKGELAQAYADAVKAMWSTGSTSYAPRKLKETVGRCESRFQGYEQHDSQEFISFLLDGLHEDLNRVQDKPVVRRHPASRIRLPECLRHRHPTPAPPIARQRPVRQMTYRVDLGIFRYDPSPPSALSSLPPRLPVLALALVSSSQGATGRHRASDRRRGCATVVGRLEAPERLEDCRPLLGPVQIDGAVPVLQQGLGDVRSLHGAVPPAP